MDFDNLITEERARGAVNGALRRNDNIPPLKIERLIEIEAELDKMSREFVRNGIEVTGLFSTIRKLRTTIQFYQNIECENNNLRYIEKWGEGSDE